MRIFYGAGHEQVAPSELLVHARLAEEAGFDEHVERLRDVIALGGRRWPS